MKPEVEDAVFLGFGGLMLLAGALSAGEPSPAVEQSQYAVTMSNVRSKETISLLCQPFSPSTKEYK